MADLSTLWLLAALGLLPPLLIAVLLAARGASSPRLVAVELGSSLTAFLLVVTSFVFDQPSSIDLALLLAMLTLPGTLLLALFNERWL